MRVDNPEKSVTMVMAWSKSIEATVNIKNLKKKRRNKWWDRKHLKYEYASNTLSKILFSTHIL